MPTFSIIIALYNQADYVPQLVASLAEQTFKSFEVHFCDDGSTDGTLQALQALQSSGAAPFALHVHTQPNSRSYAKNMNQGVRAARGQYLVFIAGDSFPDPDYLEILEEYVQEDRIICGIRIQIDTVQGVPQGVDMDWRLKKDHIPSHPVILAAGPWQLMTGNGLTVPASAMRRYGAWREDFVGYGGEDNELVARLYYKGYVCWSVPDLQLYHHWHKSKESPEESKSRSYDAVEQYGK